MTTRDELQVRRARLKIELDALNLDAKIIDERRDAVAKQIDDLTAEINVALLSIAYPPYETALLTMRIE